MWTFITPIYLKLGLRSDYTQSYRKYLLSSRQSSIYGTLYKTFELVVLVKFSLTVCKFWPLFPTCCGPIRSGYSVILGNFSKITIGFIWHCTLTSIFYWLPHHTASYFLTITHAGYIQLLVIYHFFQRPSSKERNRRVLLRYSHNI